MNTNAKCKNCGGEYGIHHYQTNQCPVGGFEGPIDRKQEYKSTIFEPESDNDISMLRIEVKNLIERIEELEEQVERLQSGHELEESVRIYGTGI